MNAPRPARCRILGREVVTVPRFWMSNLQRGTGVGREPASSPSRRANGRFARRGYAGMAVAISVGTMAGTPQAVRAASVTDYIAVSNNVMTGAPTTAANTLNTMAI